ncbi:MAG: hypothetical protein P4L99_17065 [Chthoniobacter sp.]|nr:hypothetical protein [Chthoniobacter sp.]
MADLPNVGFQVSVCMEAITNWEGVYRCNLRNRNDEDYYLSPNEQKSAAVIGRMVMDVAEKFSLQLTGAKSLNLVLAQNATKTSAKDVLHYIHDVKSMLTYELNSAKFLRATDDMVEHLDKKTPFGAYVERAFPICTEDLEESHQCFAFGRYTAAMFHLGRAMEAATELTAKKMRVTVTRKDWQHYLSAMNEKVNKMPFSKPSDKAKRAPFAETAGYFFDVKEAWRNPTFHAKKTFTREEALRVLTNAGVFLDYVAKKIFKVKIT